MTIQSVTRRFPTGNSDDFDALLHAPPNPETGNAAPAWTHRDGVELEPSQPPKPVYNDVSKESTADDFDDLIAGLTLDGLAPLPQWVAWREVDREGKLAKVPFNPHAPRKGAKANDPKTWGTRAAALRAISTMPSDGGNRGVGLQLGLFDSGERRLRLGGVDLDSCLDSATGDLEPWAAEVVDRLGTYAEVSPSGSGVKLFFTYADEDAAELAKAMRNPETGKDRHRLAWSRGTHCEIGLDVSNRYYAVTGNPLPKSPAAFRTVPLGDLLWLITEAGPAFKGEADNEATGGRDESGSGHAHRFLKDRALLGDDKAKATAALLADDGPAGEWANRTDKRQLTRAWNSAKAAADAMRPTDCADEFDEFEDPDDGDPVTVRLNKRHAVVVVRGRTLISTERKNGSVDFGTVRDIHAFYENDRVPAGDGKLEPASRRWMRNPKRQTYADGVTFAPGGCEPGTLNLWRGWAVEPDAEASCSLFLAHLREVVCRGNGDHAAYVIGWLAHMVQRPEEKPGVGLVLRGGKGAGKDTVAEYVARMIGRRHAPTVAESDHIVGKFNARLENALLLHVQEGSWAGDRKAEGVLKYLVTSDRIEIERKGIDSINLPSVLRLFISANADWVVPASPDERRWAVFEVSGARRGDDSYFSALRGEMEGKGPAALLHYLRSYDLATFKVRKPPETEGLRDQKLASLRGLELWWFETLERGNLGNWEDWATGPQTMGRDALRGQYVEWAKGRRFDGEAVDERRFGRLLRDMLPVLEDRRPWTRDGAPRVRQYLLPDLSTCREAFATWLRSPVDWDSAQ